MENVDNVVSAQVEGKKEWVAPELKKVGIEEITAHLHILTQMNDDSDPS